MDIRELHLWRWSHNMPASRKLLKHMTLFLIGGGIYVLMELVWRGHSHWSMFIVGGICFVLIGKINEWFSWSMPLWKQCLLAAVVITLIEFISGCILNLWLGLHIWDYSHEFGNILGQICLPFMGVWFVLSGVGIVLDDVCRWLLFNELKPRYKIL